MVELLILLRRRISYVHFRPPLFRADDWSKGLDLSSTTETQTGNRDFCYRKKINNKSTSGTVNQRLRHHAVVDDFQKAARFIFFFCKRDTKPQRPRLNSSYALHPNESVKPISREGFMKRV